MMQIESYKHNGYRIVIDTDDDAMSPRDADEATVMVCWHPRYNLGDEGGQAGEIKDALKRHEDYWHTTKRNTAIQRWLRIFYGATVIQPLYLLDHSGLSMSTRQSWSDPGGWDTSVVGFVFDTALTREVTGCPEDRIGQAIESDVRSYSTWLEGGFVRWTIVDNRGDYVESCGSYERIEDAKADAEAQVPAETDTTITDAEALDLIATCTSLTDALALVQRTGRSLA